MALSSAPSDMGWIATAFVVGMVQNDILGDKKGMKGQQKGLERGKRDAPVNLSD